MELNHIKYILEIYKTGSISKASNNLYVSQPYLSAYLRKFGDAIGFCIFERHNRGVSTTKEGQKLIQDLEMLHNTYLRIEQKHKLDQDALQSLSISAKRSSYIAFAIAEMINEIQESMIIYPSDLQSVQIISPNLSFILVEGFSIYLLFSSHI